MITIVDMFRQSALKDASPPLVVDFAVTRRCNLRCTHCYAAATDSPHPEELTTTEAMKLITEIAGMGARSIVFNGGEPLLRDDIYKLVNHAHMAGLATIINTNGTLLGTEAAAKLKSAGLQRLTISLKGVDPPSHNQSCGVTGTWDRSLAAMANASAVGLPYRLNAFVSHQNAAKVYDFASLARRLKAEAIEISRFVPAGRGKLHADMMLTSDDEKHIITQLLNHQLSGNGLQYRCIAIPHFWTAVSKNSAHNHAIACFEPSACGAGWDRCSVACDGTVFPCPLLHKKAGNVRHNCLTEIWQTSEILRKLRDRDKLEKKCAKCANLQDCGGARCLVFEETGSLTKSPDCAWFSKGDQASASDIVAREVNEHTDQVRHGWMAGNNSR